MAAEWMPESLPKCVKYGIDVNPWWQVDIATLTSGYESPNLVWSQARHEYSLSIDTIDPAEYAAAKAHFMEARGPFKKWPFEDPLDHEVAEVDGVVVALTGGGFRVAKRYGSGAGAYLRTISRPVGAVLYSGGVVASGVSIDPDNGMIIGADSSFDPAGYSWDGEFVVPVRYAIDRFPSRVTTKTGQGFYVSVEGINVVEVRE